MQRTPEEQAEFEEWGERGSPTEDEWWGINPSHDEHHLLRNDHNKGDVDDYDERNNAQNARAW